MSIIISPGATPPTPPVEAVSLDGVVTARRDDAWAGVTLIVDYTAVVTVPQRVRIVRVGPDGVEAPVRGADLAWAPGGLAVGYDHEAPLGAAVSWYAYPIGADGVAGERSLGASLTVPEPAGVRDVWLKSLTSPGKSLRLLVKSWPELEYAERQERFDVLGSPAPVLAVDSWSLSSGTATILTETLTERRAVLTLVTSGSVLLAQTLEAYGRPDVYVVPGGITEAMPGPAFDPVRQWSVPLTAVDRPPTVDAPLRIPGRSYADSAAIWPSYADRTATGQTYHAVTTGG